MISVVSKKTVTQSFRLNARIQSVLVAEAERQRVSTNTLVNQILEDYVDYERYEKRAKVLRFGPPIVDTIFNEISEEVIRKIGATLGENHPREMLATMGQQSFTLEKAVELIEFYLSEHAGWFEPSEIRKEQEVWTIHLRHGINRKWSLFLCAYVTAMFQTLKFYKIEPSSVNRYSTTVSMRHPSTPP